VPRAKDPPSILQRAVAALSRREHSRAELARKLSRHLAASDDPDQIERVLDRLEQQGLLSDSRFVAGLVRSRAGRFGPARIRQELKQHRIAPELVRQSVAALEATELARARDLWARRFGAAPADAAARARQIRFLAARGFRTDVILRVVRSAGDGTTDDE
jgi:regulatory protein